MNNQIKIEYKDGYIFYREHNTGPNWETVRNKYLEYIYCPVCNELIKNNQDTYMVIANSLFPNLFIHKECIIKENYTFKSSDEIKFNKLTEDLYENYQLFLRREKETKKYFSHWL